MRAQRSAGRRSLTEIEMFEVPTSAATGMGQPACSLVERRPGRLVLDAKRERAAVGIGRGGYGRMALLHSLTRGGCAGDRRCRIVRGRTAGGRLSGSGRRRRLIVAAPQPPSAAALNAIRTNPGPNLATLTPSYGGNPAILEFEFRRTGGLCPRLGGFAVENELYSGARVGWG